MFSNNLYVGAAGSVAASQRQGPRLSAEFGVLCPMQVDWLPQSAYICYGVCECNPNPVAFLLNSFYIISDLIFAPRALPTSPSYIRSGNERIEAKRCVSV